MSTPGNEPDGSVARSVRGVRTFGQAWSRQADSSSAGARRQHTSTACRETPRLVVSRPRNHFVSSKRTPTETEWAPSLDASTRAVHQYVPFPVSVYW